MGLLEDLQAFATRNVDEGDVSGLGGATLEDVTGEGDEGLLEGAGEFATRNIDDGDVSGLGGATLEQITGEGTDTGTLIYGIDGEQQVNVPEAAGDVAGGGITVIRNLGPDWLDEAAIAVIVLVVLVVLAPYAELGSKVAGDS